MTGTDARVIDLGVFVPGGLSDARVVDLGRFPRSAGPKLGNGRPAR